MVRFTSTVVAARDARNLRGVTQSVPSGKPVANSLRDEIVTKIGRRGSGAHDRPRRVPHDCRVFGGLSGYFSYYLPNATATSSRHAAFSAKAEMKEELWPLIGIQRWS